MEIPGRQEADAFPIGRSMLLGTGVALALALAVAGSVYLSMITRLDATGSVYLDYAGAALYPDEVVFTANASGATRILAEAFPFADGSRLVLTADNHNSVNGLRLSARRCRAAVHYVPLDRDLRGLDPHSWLLPAAPPVQYVSVQNDDLYRSKEAGAAFEDGTPHFLAMPAVCDGLRSMTRVGLPSIQQHVASLTSELLRRFQSLGGAI